MLVDDEMRCSISGRWQQGQEGTSEREAAMFHITCLVSNVSTFQPALLTLVRLAPLNRLVQLTSRKQIPPTTHTAANLLPFYSRKRQPRTDCMSRWPMDELHLTLHPTNAVRPA